MMELPSTASMNISTSNYRPTINLFAKKGQFMAVKKLKVKTSTLPPHLFSGEYSLSQISATTTTIEKLQIFHLQIKLLQSLCAVEN